jgi:ATP-binding cassette subfamily F protein 3
MIQLQQIYLQYSDRIIFDYIDLSISPGEKIGLVGRNGAGKSTLMKVIAGDVRPDSGQINRPNGSTLAHLHQDLILQTDKTVIELASTAFEELHTIDSRLEEINAELAVREDYESKAYADLLDELSGLTERLSVVSPDEAEALTEKILKGLGFKSSDFNRPLREFSGGWQMRVELAKMLLQLPDYLLLDEPTNHLDIDSILWLESFLKQYTGAVILISHDKQFLDNVTKRTIEVELGNVYDYKANYSKYLDLRAERREKLQAAYENQQKVIAEKERTINRFIAKANKTKMAQSMKKQLDKMERIEIDAADTHTMNIRFQPSPRSAQIVLKANNISKSYGSLDVLNRVDFQIERGQKIAFVGQNGQGKTTLAKILIKEEFAQSGLVEMGSAVELGYYAQNQAEALGQDQTVLQAIESVSPEEMRPRLRGILGAFMFSGEDVDKKVKVLSGGERARLALACLLLRPINLLVLDEPTNHLDILSKEVLKEALRAYDGTLLVVSHDRDFLRGLTDHVVEFRDKQIKTYLGDIDYYLEKKAFDNMREVELNTAVKKSNQQDQVNSKPLLNAEDQKNFQRSLQNLEKKIEKLEQEKLELEDQMTAPDFYEQQGHKIILSKHELLGKELSELYKEWEMIAEKIEG